MNGVLVWPQDPEHVVDGLTKLVKLLSSAIHTTFVTTFTIQRAWSLSGHVGNQEESHRQR